MLLAIFLFIVGLVFLIKGGDIFVDSACKIAHKFHIPEIIIGATIVSIGTTLPEVMVSATSAVSGHGEMAYGNAIGSIICNTSLIAALTIAIRPTKVNKNSLVIPSIFFFVSAIFYAVISYAFGRFTRVTGIILLALFFIYMFTTIKTTKKEEIKEEEVKENAETEDKKDKTIIDFVLLVVGAALIAFGANLLVDNGTIIAKGLGVPESVIALTFVALGTSLPELITAINSLVKGHSSLSLGNIIGANLFNLVLVSSASIILSPFALPANKTILGVNSTLLIDVPLMIIVMLILVIPPLIKGKLYRFQGILLLLIYASFCVFQFVI